MRLTRANLTSRGLSVFFKLLYHQMAWSYDAVAAIVSLGRWKKWVLAVAPHLTGSQILELGFGPGHLQKAVLTGGGDIIGVDASHQMSRQANRRIRKCGLLPQLIQGLGQFLPFPNISFDQIVATFPTEYIHRRETLQELFRVLKPGGELIILPAAWITGRSPLERIANWLFRVTGQAPSEQPIDQQLSSSSLPEIPPLLLEAFVHPLQAAGFHTSSEIRHQGTELLLFIRGKKPG